MRQRSSSHDWNWKANTITKIAHQKWVFTFKLLFFNFANLTHILGPHPILSRVFVDIVPRAKYGIILWTIAKFFKQHQKRKKGKTFALTKSANCVDPSYTFHKIQKRGTGKRVQHLGMDHYNNNHSTTWNMMCQILRDVMELFKHCVNLE